MNSEQIHSCVNENGALTFGILQVCFKNKTRLANANRSRVSVHVTKILAREGGVVDHVKISSHLV